MKENVDEAQRIEVFRLNSVDGSRRSLNDNNNNNCVIGTCELIQTPSTTTSGTSVEKLNTKPKYEPDIMIKKQMYYNKYDNDEGVGFYPQISRISRTIRGCNGSGGKEKGRQVIEPELLSNSYTIIQTPTDMSTEVSIYITFKPFVYKLGANRSVSVGERPTSGTSVEELDTMGWIQCSGPVIYGFTKRNGIELLDSLNKDANINAMVISNYGGRIIYPMMYNSTYYILENYSK